MDIEKELYKFRKILMGGFYEIIVLLILNKSETPMYGYMISKLIERLSYGKIKLTVGTLYPILKKLEKKKFIRGFWAEPKQGPPRKYYEITDEGKEFLCKALEIIDDLIKLVKSIRGE